MFDFFLLLNNILISDAEIYDEYQTKAHFIFPTLKKVAKQVLDQAPENSNIVLIGHSPSYLKPFLEEKRNVVNIAISGISKFKELNFDQYSDQYSFFPENLECYCSYLKENIFFDREIFFVDVSLKGDSIISFLKILKYCFKDQYEKNKINLMIFQQNSKDLQDFLSSYIKKKFYDDTNLVDYYPLDEKREEAIKIRNEFDDYSLLFNILNNIKDLEQGYQYYIVETPKELNENLQNFQKEGFFKRYYCIDMDLFYMNIIFSSQENSSSFIPRYVPSYGPSLWDKNPDFDSLHLENGKKFLNILKEMVEKNQSE